MILLLACSICMCMVSGVYVQQEGGKKITFSTVTSLDYEKIKFNKNNAEFGSPEYYESQRWVAVDSEGYEYEGTLEEVMRDISPASTVDEGEDDMSENHSVDEQAAVASYLDLSKAMDGLTHSAEKRSVIGDDTRRRVLNPKNRFPYTAIGRLDIGCTGTFIARRTILTAGHCVHEGNGGKWYNNKQLTFRRSKDCDPNNGEQTHKRHMALALKGWTQYGYNTHDFAVIIVYQDSPAVMEYASALSSISRGMINIAGYPGDKPGRCMWMSSCTLKKVQDEVLHYPCDTARGMSGSGVYMYWENSNKRVIYGVHAYGARSSNQLNQGTRITKYYEKMIKQWIYMYKGN